MGIDFGGKRIGIAFSDPSATLASAYEVYNSRGEKKDIEYLAELAEEMSAKVIVIGLPFNADGTECEMTLRVRQFGCGLAEKTGKQVEFEDERFTSLEADEMLKESGRSWQERKKILDMVSAEIILQNYLNKIKRG